MYWKTLGFGAICLAIIRWLDKNMVASKFKLFVGSLPGDVVSTSSPKDVVLTLHCICKKKEGIMQDVSNKINESLKTKTGFTIGGIYSSKHGFSS